MSDQPAPTLESEPELFDLAARLMGKETVDLLKVRQDGNMLVVVLITGQKFVLDLPGLAATLKARMKDEGGRMNKKLKPSS